MDKEGNNKRKSIRHKDWNYSWPGYYFITICVKNKKCVFGDVVEQNNYQGACVELSAIGRIVGQIWQSIPKHHQVVELGEFVVMPNHIHGVIGITPRRGDARIAPTNARIAPTRKLIKEPSGSLSTIIGSFKSEASKQIHRISGYKNFSWQRNYYEHIVRNNYSLEKIKNYIINNPQKWHDDIENPYNYCDSKARKNYYNMLFLNDK